MRSTFDVITNGNRNSKFDYKSTNELCLEVYEKKIREMDRDDRIVINDIVREDGRRLYYNGKLVKNFGRVAKIELLGNLGIFLSQFSESEIRKALAQRRMERKRTIDLDY